MDDLARFNQARSEELAQRRIAFSRPVLDLDADTARRYVDPEGLMGEAEGRDVLCLAGGGGQQSAAFGVLGARVTVLDLCKTQLERDREAAAHYGLTVRTLQGDMRDLSRFPEDAFDIVWHAHSINFVPSATQVYDQVVRVLRPGGKYRLSCTNPLVHGIDERDFHEGGYVVRLPYIDGAELAEIDQHWDFEDDQGASHRVEGPKEFRHILSTLFNGLIRRGFRILGVFEDADTADAEAAPGTWEHFQSILPPFLVIWAELE